MRAGKIVRAAPNEREKTKITNPDKTSRSLTPFEILNCHVFKCHDPGPLLKS